MRDVSGQAARPLYAAKDRHMVVNIRWLGNVVFKVMVVYINCILDIASCLLLVF